MLGLCAAWNPRAAGRPPQTWLLLPLFSVLWPCPSSSCPSSLKVKISTELGVRQGQSSRGGMETISYLLECVFATGQKGSSPPIALLHPDCGRASDLAPTLRREKNGFRNETSPHLSNHISEAIRLWQSFWVPQGKQWKALGSHKGSFVLPCHIRCCTLMALSPCIHASGRTCDLFTLMSISSLNKPGLYSASHHGLVSGDTEGNILMPPVADDLVGSQTHTLTHLTTQHERNSSGASTEL